MKKKTEDTVHPIFHRGTPRVNSGIAVICFLFLRGS